MVFWILEEEFWYLQLNAVNHTENSKPKTIFWKVKYRQEYPPTTIVEYINVEMGTITKYHDTISPFCIHSKGGRDIFLSHKDATVY